MKVHYSPVTITFKGKKRVLSQVGGVYYIDGARKNKNRHLSREQRKNFSKQKDGVQLFNGSVAENIPFNTIKNLTKKEIEETYVDKALDTSVIPFNNIFVANQVIDSPKSMNVVIEKDPEEKVKATDGTFTGEELELMRKFFQIEDITQGTETPKEAVEKMKQIKTIAG